MDLIPNNPDVLSDACQGNGPRATEKHPNTVRDVQCKVGENPPKGFVVLAKRARSTSAGVGSPGLARAPGRAEDDARRPVEKTGGE